MNQHMTEQPATVTGPSDRPIRILSMPGRTYVGNPYWKCFCEAFDAVGAEIVEPRDKRALLMRFDVLHIHFPDHWVTEVAPWKALLTAPAFLAFLVLARLFGRQIVWTVHDVEPFKTRPAWLLRPFMALVRRLVTGYVFMNASSRRAFMARFPALSSKPQLVVSHGTFPVPEVSDARCLALRRELTGGTEAFVLGYLGDIKPYKNIGALADIPRHDRAGRPIIVAVAGRLDRATDPATVDDALSRAGPDRIRRFDRRLDDLELTEFIRAVDAVVLPYLIGSNSGFAILVLAAGGRLVTSALPMFRDLEDEFGAPWVHCEAPDGRRTLAEAVLAAAAARPDGADRARRDALLAAQSFTANAHHLLAFYGDLGHRARHGRTGG